MTWERARRPAIKQKQLTVTCNYASVQCGACRDSAGSDGEPSREFCFSKLLSNDKKMAKRVFCRQFSQTGSYTPRTSWKKLSYSKLGESEMPKFRPSLTNTTQAAATH